MATTFSEYINSKTPVLVDFCTEWCNPCTIMKPVLQELKSRIGEKARIIKLDIDTNPRAATLYDVKTTPTLMLFKKGKILWRQAGVVSTNELQEILSGHI